MTTIVPITPRPVAPATARLVESSVIHAPDTSRPAAHRWQHEPIDSLGLTADGQSLPGVDRPAFDWPKEPW